MMILTENQMKMTVIFLICLVVLPLAVESQPPCADSCDFCAFAGRGRCDFCKLSFALHPSLQCIPGCTISNCGRCSYNSKKEKNECMECNQGYGPKDGICERCPNNCALCGTKAILCDECMPGFGKDLSDPPQCTITCKQGCNCRSANTCEKCVNGHKDSADACVPCQWTECKSCNTDRNQCESCVDKHLGYRKTSSGRCRKCNPACLACTENGQCNQDGCVRGTRYDSSTKSCVECPAGCEKCTSSATTCDDNSCQPGWKFVPQSKICMRCHPLCQIGQCSDEGKCNSNKCLPGAGFVSTSKTCTPCPYKCKTCNKAMGDVCDDDGCYESHYLDSTTHECTACPPNCLSCSSGTVCKNGQCAEGFFYDSSSKTCEACGSGCLECDNQATCRANGCGKQYNFNNGQCVGKCKTENCKTCPSDPLCDTCLEGFYLASPENKCKRCFDGCATCTHISSCSTCAASYAQTDRPSSTNVYCLECSPHCETCDSSRMCLKCEAGFYLEKNYCKHIECYPNCGSCASANCLPHRCPFGKDFDKTTTKCSCKTGSTFDSASKKCKADPNANPGRGNSSPDPNANPGGGSSNPDPKANPGRGSSTSDPKANLPGGGSSRAVFPQCHVYIVIVMLLFRNI